MNANQLLNALLEMMTEGIDLEQVQVNFRENRDSMPVRVNFLEEDLRDESDRLTSIMLLNSEEEGDEE